MLFPEKETAERNFLYGYDVAESSSDVDATSYSFKQFRIKRRDINMKTAAWKSHDLLLGSGFTYRFFFSARLYFTGFCGDWNMIFPLVNNG